MDLQARLLDPQQSVLLYGTTPPRVGTPDEAVLAAAEKLAARVRGLPIDGLIVYDIQDETGRTQQPRPFAFTGTVDPRRYAELLMPLAGRPAVIYKCIGELDEPAWNEWLDKSARDAGLRLLSIVGRPTSGVRYPLPLARAIRLAVEHPAGFTVGGVAIAERHTRVRSESARLLAKGIAGCGYFISQTVYHPQATERLLRDYLRDCRGAGVEPRRIVLTFAPCGRERTMTFLRWLGVKMPRDTARAILGAPSPLAKSIEICRENLRRILDHDYVRTLPIGINVESVSIYRDEIDASVELLHALAEVVQEVSPTPPSY